jgi:hypothetical protein
MYNPWPITATQAARRLDLSVTEVCTLVRGLGLAVGRAGQAFTIDEPAFERLREASFRINADRRPGHRRRKAEPAPV